MDEKAGFTIQNQGGDLTFTSIVTSKIFWLALGLFGQTVFFMRFFVQWLASEKAKKSTIPVSFWYFSILGGLITLVYAIHQKDPVFILGQSTGLFIYLRNLWFIKKHAQVDSD